MSDGAISRLGCSYIICKPLQTVPGRDPKALTKFRWNVATVIILLNILISLFSSAYDDVRLSFH